MLDFGQIFRQQRTDNQKNVQLAKEDDESEQNSGAIRYYGNLKYSFPSTNQQTLTLWHKFWRSVAWQCDPEQSQRIWETAKISKKLSD